MDNDLEDEVESELMVLQSIYEDKISIKRSNKGRVVEITVYPATAESLNSQYVCLQISFLLDHTYPNTNPEISFTMSRGLSDSNMNELFLKMKNFAREHSNECILFDLMEMAKEDLTSNNVPSCSCSICLVGFHESDDFLKTDCYHYFHSFCMNQYFTYHLQQRCEDNDIKVEFVDGKENAVISCPICRNLVNLNIESLKKAHPPLIDFNHEIDPEIKNRHIQQFKAHYEKQLQNGGLIDLEYEKNKHLLSNMEQAYLNQVASKQRDKTDGVPEDDLSDMVNGTESMSISNTSTVKALNGDSEQKKSHPSMSRNSRGRPRAHFHGRGNYIQRNRNFQTHKNVDRQQIMHFRQGKQKEYKKVDQSRCRNSRQQNYNGQSSSFRDSSHRKLQSTRQGFAQTRQEDLND